MNLSELSYSNNKGMKPPLANQANLKVKVNSSMSMNDDGIVYENTCAEKNYEQSNRTSRCFKITKIYSKRTIDGGREP